jgi:hypothetical protein
VITKQGDETMTIGSKTMTEQEMIEIWGDGTEFGMSSPIKIGYRGDDRDMGVLNKAFGDVAMRFASKVAEIAYQKGYVDGAAHLTVSIVKKTINKP